MDTIDEQILAILMEDARTPISEIARAVQLSPAPVARRIDRLERARVIKGYTALVDRGRLGGLASGFHQ